MAQLENGNFFRKLYIHVLTSLFRVLALIVRRVHIKYTTLRNIIRLEYHRIIIYYQFYLCFFV